MTRAALIAALALATNTTITHWGVTLHKIRATEDIPRHGVRKGDLGGYVSSTHLPSGDAEILQTWHYLVVGPIGSEGTNATLTRTKGGGHRLSVGCWEDGSLGTLMTEVKRRRRSWSADAATQELWMQQYRALRKLGKAVVARWTVTES